MPWASPAVCTHVLRKQTAQLPASFPGLALRSEQAICPAWSGLGRLPCGGHAYTPNPGPLSARSPCRSLCPFCPRQGVTLPVPSVWHLPSPRTSLPSVPRPLCPRFPRGPLPTLLPRHTGPSRLSSDVMCCWAGLRGPDSPPAERAQSLLPDSLLLPWLGVSLERAPSLRWEGEEPAPPHLSAGLTWPHWAAASCAWPVPFRAMPLLTLRPGPSVDCAGRPLGRSLDRLSGLSDTHVGLDLGPSRCWARGPRADAGPCAGLVDVRAGPAGRAALGAESLSGHPSRE